MALRDWFRWSRGIDLRNLREQNDHVSTTYFYPISRIPTRTTCLCTRGREANPQTTRSLLKHRVNPGDTRRRDGKEWHSNTRVSVGSSGVGSWLATGATYPNALPYMNVDVDISAQDVWNYVYVYTAT